MAPPSLQGVTALNVYKKVAIIRRSTDAISYEDATGSVKTISDLGEAALTAATPLAKPKPKDDIPVPKIKNVDAYSRDVPDNYDIKLSYVRHHRQTKHDLDTILEYVVDEEDEAWLAQNTKFGGAQRPAGTAAIKQSKSLPASLSAPISTTTPTVPGTGTGTVARTGLGTTIAGDESKKSAPLMPGSLPTTAASAPTITGTTGTAAAPSLSLSSSLTATVQAPAPSAPQLATTSDSAATTTTTTTAAHAEAPKATTATATISTATAAATTPSSSSVVLSAKPTNVAAATLKTRSNASGTASAYSQVGAATNQHRHRQHQSAAQAQLQPPPPPTRRLPIRYLEIMFDTMEKATGFDAIITLDQADALISKRIPDLYRMYPLKAKAGVVTVKQVLTDIYNYWIQKRSKLKRPLLRRFWPITSADDTNPHLVFRPREKEKYKLRKKRQNDMDAYRKLKQLRQDFEQLRLMMALVKRREQIHRSTVVLCKEWFQQSLYDAIDTSGQPRKSTRLEKDKVDEAMQVKTYFDAEGWQNRQASVDDAEDALVDNQVDFGEVAEAKASAPSDANGPAPMIIAGQNHGEPAPNFLQPLPTRQSYVTSWDDAVPHVPTYDNARPLPTNRFRHRPRVGRGGRICIDRMPQFVRTVEGAAPPTVYTAGMGLMRSQKPRHRLLDLLPEPLDRHAINHKVEQICMEALEEDYARIGKPVMMTTDGDENDGDVAIVKMDDWLNTDDQMWGEERYSIGPL